MKENEIYNKNPEIIAYFSIKDGKLTFNFDDKRISIAEIMILNSNLLNEYVKSIAMANQEQTQQTQQ